MYESCWQRIEILALSLHLNMKIPVDNFFPYMPESRPVPHQRISQEVDSGNLETVLSGQTRHRLPGLFALVQKVKNNLHVNSKWHHALLFSEIFHKKISVIKCNLKSPKWVVLGSSFKPKHSLMSFHSACQIWLAPGCLFTLSHFYIRLPGAVFGLKLREPRSNNSKLNASVPLHIQTKNPI